MRRSQNHHQAAPLQPSKCRCDFPFHLRAGVCSAQGQRHLLLSSLLSLSYWDPCHMLPPITIVYTGSIPSVRDPSCMTAALPLFLHSCSLLRVFVPPCCWTSPVSLPRSLPTCSSTLEKKMGRTQRHPKCQTTG